MSKKAYLGLGLPLIVNLILCFFFGWPLAVIERLIRKSWLWAILAIFLGPIFWVVDFISFIVNNNDIKWLV